MQWRQFVMNLGSLNADRVEAVFSRHGAQAVTLTDAGSDAVLEAAPGETPLWAESRITGLFSDSADLSALKNDLLGTFGLGALPKHRVDELADRPWEREWLKDIRPMCFGDRLWIASLAHEIDVPDAVIVRLDPGLAFGTGRHPTTALCLRWLDGLDVTGKTVLDYGCGSGILGIAALLLGAKAVSALDNDPQAITASMENARNNGVGDRLFVTQEVAMLQGAFDIVIANIVAESLVHHAREISGRVASGGMLALSGILAEQADIVMDAYRDWIDFEEPAIDRSTDEDWVRLAGKRT
ncbi:MAG: 50S ribosomal protein L11 methyltransferase [Woeseia sp.]